VVDGDRARFVAGVGDRRGVVIQRPRLTAAAVQVTIDAEGFLEDPCRILVVAS
jgi:hypothetical protein